MTLAQLVLVVHLAVIAFNLFGLVVIPIGAWRRWRFVHAPGWRIAHLILLAAVALQAVLGRACILTIWQDELSGQRSQPPLIMRWVDQLIFWPLPVWAFATAYVAVFAYALALLWLAPLRRGGAP